MKPISVYDGTTMKRLAYLQNAYDIHFTQHVNALWIGGFSMPFQDPKNSYCQPFNFVELWDVDGSGADRYVGLFRIMPRVENILGIDASIQYTLEHVLSTLLDDIMLGWHEVGNTGVYTANVVSYILERQTKKRWALSQCDYRHQYLYGWQDENLLSALYSVVGPFSETDYYWSFDTLSTPWRLGLRKTSPTAVTDVRYKKNLFGITKTVDPSNLTTRLYCYGAGDGDNKLNIKNVNNGLPYLQSVNASKYGIITQVWTDERFTIEESLKATGQAMLKQLEEPSITYTMDINTISSAANLKIGDTVRLVEGLIDDYMVVQELSKTNLSGAPKSGKVIIGHGTVDVGDSMADIAERQRISETYSQGSESIYMDSFYDNADPTYPMESTFTIPENADHVNEIRFTAKLTNFRAYSRATQGGGAGTPTSSAGGSSSPTSSAGGGGSVTSSSGGGGSPTTGYNGNNQLTSGNNNIISSTTGAGGYNYKTLDITNVLPNGSGKTHNHGLAWNAQLVSGPITVAKNATGAITNLYYSTAGYFAPSGDHYHNFTINDHSHSFSIPSHSHSVSIPSHLHYVYLDSHQHSVSYPTHQHTVSIPSHQHTVTIPNHVHNIEYGIYRGPVASSMSIYLDDKLLGTYTGSVRNINLIDSMSKNANGDVLRGDHRIRIVPNSLTRIEVNYQVRMFTNSRGGGQF